MKLFLILLIVIWTAKSEYICTDNACADGWILQRDTSSCCTGVCVPDEGPRDLFKPVMDCSTVRCALPKCDSYYTPPGECCPVCCEPVCEALCGGNDDGLPSGGPYKCCGDGCVKDCSAVSCPFPEDCPPDRLIVDEGGCCLTCLETCKQPWNLKERPQNCMGDLFLDSECQWVCECDSSQCKPIECPKGSYPVQKEGECCPVCEGLCSDCCPEGQNEYYEDGSNCAVCLTCNSFAPLEPCEDYQTRVYSPDQPCGVCEPDCTDVQCGKTKKEQKQWANLQRCKRGEVFVRDEGQCCSGSCQLDCSGVLCIAIACAENEEPIYDGCCITRCAKRCEKGEVFVSEDGSCQPDCSKVLCIAIACIEPELPVYEGCCIARCENYCDKVPQIAYSILPGYTTVKIPGTCWDMDVVLLEPCAGLECIHPEKCPEGQHLSTLPGECCPQCRACGVHEIRKLEVEVNGAMCKPCGEPIVEKICAGGCAGDICCSPTKSVEVTYKVRCFKEWLEPQWYDDVYKTKSVVECGCQK